MQESFAWKGRKDCISNHRPSSNFSGSKGNKTKSCWLTFFSSDSGQASWLYNQISEQRLHLASFFTKSQRSTVPLRTFCLYALSARRNTAKREVKLSRAGYWCCTPWSWDLRYKNPETALENFGQCDLKWTNTQSRKPDVFFHPFGYKKSKKLDCRNSGY